MKSPSWDSVKTVCRSCGGQACQKIVWISLDYLMAPADSEDHCAFVSLDCSVYALAAVVTYLSANVHRVDGRLLAGCELMPYPSVRPCSCSHQIDLASGTFTLDYRSGSPCSALYRKIATADNCVARVKGSEHAGIYWCWPN